MPTTRRWVTKSMINFTEAAANGGLLFAGLFMATFLYVFITDAL